MPNINQPYFSVASIISKIDDHVKLLHQKKEKNKNSIFSGTLKDTVFIYESMLEILQKNKDYESIIYVLAYNFMTNKEYLEILNEGSLDNEIRNSKLQAINEKCLRTLSHYDIILYRQVKIKSILD